MGINIIEQQNEEPFFEYKIPGFINEDNKLGNSSGDYAILQVLGGGGFSSVLKVKSKINSKIYAMKKVDMNKILNVQQLDQKYFDNEVQILKRLSHPNIIKCYRESLKKVTLSYPLVFKSSIIYLKSIEK